MTFGGIAATGALIFGAGLFMAGSMMGTKPAAHTSETHESKSEAPAATAHEEKSAHAESKPAHGEEKPSHGEEKKGHEEAAAEHGGEHGEKHGDKHAEKAPILEDNTEELDQFILRFNDLVARGMNDDARVIALKAYALGGQKDAAWLRRLADTTFLSDALPAQQRYTKAYENYSALIAGAEGGATQTSDREWAQYRAAICLRQMGRWDDALEASASYLERFPGSPRRNEVHLMHAQGLFANGHRAEAREEIEEILKDNPTAEIRAKALLELAMIDSERARVEPGDAPVQGLTRAEVVPIDETASNNLATEELTGIPTARWQAIVAAAKAGKVDEAHRLLEPMVKAGGPLSTEQRARVTLNFAKLLRELPEQQTAR